MIGSPKTKCLNVYAILLITTIRNIWGTMRRTWMLILGLKRLKLIALIRH